MRNFWRATFIISGIILIGSIPGFSLAANLNLSTQKTQFVIGDTFSVDIKIDSQDAGINAAQATLQYPKDIVQVSGVDKAGSVFDFWLQDPSYDNGTGRVSFIGGSASGVSGKTLQVLKINFTITGSGTANLTFTDGAITASDGSGTNVLSLMSGLVITSITKQEATRIPAPDIPPAPAAPGPEGKSAPAPVPVVKQIERPAVPTGKLPIQPVVTVPLYPHPDSWYNAESNFLVQWDLPKDITNVATLINKEPTFEPTVSEGLFDNKTFPVLTDGVWYLHIRFKNNIGWGPTTHYKIGIDTTPPLAFAVTSKEGLDTAIITPTITYQTNDQPSGVATYKIIIDKNQPISTSATSYTLPPQDPGNHNVAVEANDFAGNKTITTIKIHIQERSFLAIGGFSITQFWFFVIIITILLVSFVGGWQINRLWLKQVQRKGVIAQRDVANTFAMVLKDVNKILEMYNDAQTNGRAKSEATFLLNKIKGDIEKAQKYVVENIEEITK